MPEPYSTAESAKSAEVRRECFFSALLRVPLRLCVKNPVRSFGAVLLALLFVGALLWAKGRDPFERRWFSVQPAGAGRAECVAVVPKASPKSKVQSLKSVGRSGSNSPIERPGGRAGSAGGRGWLLRARLRRSHRLRRLKLRYRTRARKYWPGNAGLMALVNASVEPLTVFV